MEDAIFDGKQLIDQLLVTMTLANDPKAGKLLLIGRKYGLDAVTTLAFLAELGSVLNTEGGGEEDGKTD